MRVLVLQGNWFIIMLIVSHLVSFGLFLALGFWDRFVPPPFVTALLGSWAITAWTLNGTLISEGVFSPSLSMAAVLHSVLFVWGAVKGVIFEQT